MLQLYINIKRRRLELDMSQDELASKTGYKDRSSIAKIEKGLVDLPQTKIELFATALRTTPSELMGWEEDSSTAAWQPTLNQRDLKEIDQIIANTRQLLQQDGLMFDGKPAADDDVQSIIDAMEIGLELAKKKSKEKFTPKKYKK